MTVALILDFPDGRKAQYEEVVRRMDLGGRLAPGGKVHCAGSYEGGWRVIDVWEDAASWERFRDEQVIPNVLAVDLAPPITRTLEVDMEGTGSGGTPELVQVVVLPGLTRETFHAADAEVLPGGQMPAGVTFHVNGPVEEGWMVIDGWTSKEARDTFMKDRVGPAMEGAPLDGPVQVEDLMVEATLG